MKALVADDTKNIRNLLTTCLELEGYDVLQANDGQQAMDILNNSKVDLVFLDIKMPQISGTEVLRKIRDMGNCTPVIIMTAFATVRNAIECTKLGAVAYLQKPFSADKVKLVMEELSKENIDVEQKKYQEIEKVISNIENMIFNKEYDDALILLKKAISEDTTNPKIYYLLSKAYEGIGDNDNAQKFFYTYKMFS